MKKKSDDQVYFIEAATSRATRIGKRMISPEEAPKGLTEAEYNASKREIEHYVEAGTIMLHTPGTSASAQAAKEVKAEHKRRSEIIIGKERDSPPSPRELKPVAEPNAESDMPTFSVPGEDAEDTGRMKCVVKTTAGTRCKADAVSKHVVCAMHLRILKKSKKLEDTAGNRILKNGKDIAPA